ncbi:uncharacterized protein [Diadema setosum]|uniref:uncharacterized protein n=1 Tax=Diadema setosum TaxID=31175 RepID=UPI003B3A7949
MFMQALNGFIIVIQADGQIFYASPSIQEYLGFQDADIMHQNVFELIHKEDREDFQKQLLVCPPPTCSTEVSSRPHPAAPGNGPLDDSSIPPEINDAEPVLDRVFTSRLRCLLDESSGFLSLQFTGRLRMLYGQRTRGKDGIPVDIEPPEMALFALACPLQQPSIMEIHVRSMIFRTKHKLDFKTITLDTKGSEVLGYTDNEFSSLPGYQYIHYEDIIYCSEMHSSLIRKGETGFIYFRLMTKVMKWLWVQAKGKVIYKNGKPEYLMSTHRPMSDEEGEQHLANRRRPFKFPFQGKAELYDCNPPYPPIPPFILQALQRGEMPSLGAGPPPGIAMGGMPPGMGSLPPGMADFPPPGGMPPFGGPMPFGDGGGPPPFACPQNGMFSPRPDRGVMPSFDQGLQRSQFKSSPSYSPPSYACDGAGSEMNGDSDMSGMFGDSQWQGMNGEGKWASNGFSGHFSPDGSMPSPSVASEQMELSKGFDNGNINVGQSWNGCPSANVDSGVMPNGHFQSSPSHSFPLNGSDTNTCSPRSVSSGDSGITSLPPGQKGWNTPSRRVAVVSPCQASQEVPKIQQSTKKRSPVLSTGSVDSGMGNLPFENGDDIPTFDEALSLSSLDPAQQAGIKEALLMCGDESLITNKLQDGGQTFPQEPFRSMPEQIGPKLETNAMQYQPPRTLHQRPEEGSCNVLRSLLSNPNPSTSCKQEEHVISSPVTSMTHPNTVEWRNPVPVTTAPPGVCYPPPGQSSMNSHPSQPVQRSQAFQTDAMPQGPQSNHLPNRAPSKQAHQNHWQHNQVDPDQGSYSQQGTVQTPGLQNSMATTQNSHGYPSIVHQSAVQPQTLPKSHNSSQHNHFASQSTATGLPIPQHQQQQLKMQQLQQQQQQLKMQQLQQQQQQLRMQQLQQQQLHPKQQLQQNHLQQLQQQQQQQLQQQQQEMFNFQTSLPPMTTEQALHRSKQQQLQQQPNHQPQQTQPPESQQEEAFGFQTNSLPLMTAGLVQCATPHQQQQQPLPPKMMHAHHQKMMMERRGYHSNQKGMPNGVGGLLPALHQEVPFGGSPQPQNTALNLMDLVDSSLSSEFLSAMMPCGAPQMKGVVAGGGSLLENGFQVALTHSSNA